MTSTTRNAHADTLGWLRAIGQFASVVLTLFATSLIPVIALGQTNAGLLASVLVSTVAALWIARLWLQRDGDLARAWDVSLADNWRRTLGLAMAALGAIVLIFWGGDALVDRLGLPPVDVSEVMDKATAGPGWFAAWVILVACGAAGIGEELLWRGFILDRLLHLRGMASLGTGARFWLANIIQAVIFGLPHAYQGLGGMLVTATVGLLLGWLRRMAGGSLLPGILAHGSVDSLMMAIGYAQMLGWIANG